MTLTLFALKLEPVWILSYLLIEVDINIHLTVSYRTIAHAATYIHRISSISLSSLFQVNRLSDLSVFVFLKPSLSWLSQSLTHSIWL